MVPFVTLSLGRELSIAEKILLSQFIENLTGLDCKCTHALPVA